MRFTIITLILLLFALPAMAVDTALVDRDGVTQPLVLNGSNIKGVAAVIDLVKDGGAVADSNGTHGSGADNHDAIMAALASSVSTGRPLYIPRGIYRTSPISYWFNHDTLKIYGEGTIFIDDDTTAIGVFINGNSKTTGGSLDLSGVKFTRYNTSTQRSGAYVLMPYAMQNVAIRNIEVSGSAYASLMVNICGNASVTDSKIHDGWRDGLDFGDTDVVSATGNTVWNTGDDGIAVAGNTTFVTKAVVANNVLYNIGGPSNGGSCIKVASNISNVLVEGNALKGCYAGGISAANFTVSSSGTSKVDIKNNTIEGTQLYDTSYYSNGAGIVIGNQNNSYPMDNFNVVGNTLYGAGIYVGADTGGYAAQIKNINIANNTIYSPNYSGIKAYYVDGLTVTGNKIFSAGWNGIDVSNVNTRLQLSGNEVNDYSTTTTAANGVKVASAPTKFLFIGNGVSKVDVDGGNEYAISSTALVDILNTTGTGSVTGIGSAAKAALVTTVGATGSDSNVPTEKAVRAAITAASGAITVKETDGSPSGTATTLNFPNGSVTDNGGGAFTVAFPNSGGGTVTGILATAPLASDGNAVTPTLSMQPATDSVNGYMTATDHTALSAKAIAPATNTADYVPQWNGANSKTLKDGLTVANYALNNSLAQRTSTGILQASSFSATMGTTGSSSSLQDATAQETLITKGSPSGLAFMDFVASPADGTSDAFYRFGRLTTTTGKHYVQFLKGNGTTTANAQIGGNTDTYFAVDNSAVGIGTSTPAQVLDVVKSSDTAAATVQVTGYSTNGAQSAGVALRHSRGLLSGIATRSKSGDLLGSVNARGAYAADDTSASTFPSSAKGLIGFYASEDQTSSAEGTEIRFATTVNGSASRTEKLRLYNDGGLQVGGTFGTSPGAGNVAAITFTPTIPPATTYGATTTIDLSLGDSPSVTLTGNTTLAFSNPKAGQWHRLNLVQDATGSRTVTWPSTGLICTWRNTASNAAPVLLTGANKVDTIIIHTLSTTSAECWTGGNK